MPDLEIAITKTQLHSVALIGTFIIAMRPFIFILSRIEPVIVYIILY